MDPDPDQTEIDALVGRTIVSGSIGEGGMHLELDDGRIFVIVEGIVAVVGAKERTLQ